jgi:hypothetical protein
MDASTGSIRRADVPALFRPPAAPAADAAAARAALAGVTRLEVRGYAERKQLAAALLHLPGLRAASLVCACEAGAFDSDEARAHLVAALARCPMLESLEWRAGGFLSRGAQGSGGAGAPGAARARGRGRRPPGGSGGVDRCVTPRKLGHARVRADTHAYTKGMRMARACTVFTLEAPDQHVLTSNRTSTPAVTTLQFCVPRCDSFAAALPALTSLRVSSSKNLHVPALTGLRRLEVRAEDCPLPYETICSAVEGLSALTALQDLRLEGRGLPLARPSDLAPLTALTRLAMTCVPLELAPHPLAARLRRLELQGFDDFNDFVGGPAAAALAALAGGAPLLERLVIRVDDSYRWDADDLLLQHQPISFDIGEPLGAGVSWPSLTHLEMTSWAAALLADCAFPRLSRVSAFIVEGHDSEFHIPKEQLRTAVAALAAKARDHAALRVIDFGEGVFHAAATAAPPGPRAPAPPVVAALLARRRPRGAARRLGAPRGLAESLELTGPLADFGYAEPLAALTGLTRLLLNSEDGVPLPEDAAFWGDDPPPALAAGALVRAPRALARLPRLAHLRLTFDLVDGFFCRFESDSTWLSLLVAAALARCPTLRLLEVGRPEQRLSPRWAAFGKALRAGGCGAELRPAPASEGAVFAREFGVEW